jgi:secreted PhoX family phosphatase
MMADDVRCPNPHDGMAVIDAQGNSGHLILVRNHEGDPLILRLKLRPAHSNSAEKC